MQKKKEKRGKKDHDQMIEIKIIAFLIWGAQEGLGLRGDL